MISFTRVPRATMDKRHAAARRLSGNGKMAATVKKPGPQVKNTQYVLDLGNLKYFTFRGRAYGVPPVPYKEGLELATLQSQVETFVGQMSQETIPDYLKLLRTIHARLWDLCVVTGPIQRKLRAWGLLRNPFRKCTEAELGELLGFFLTRRMTSGVGYGRTAALSLRPGMR